jgi:hypothetical protein
MKLIYTQQEKPLFHEGYFEAIRILGAQDTQILNYLLRLYESDHLIPGNPGSFVNYSTSLAVPAGTVELVYNSNGPVVIYPSDIEMDIPSPYISIEITVHGSVALLKGGKSSWTVPCQDMGSRLHIEWPEAFKINGDLGYPLADPMILNLPVSYPVKDVANRLTASSEVYDFLEKYGLESTYHVADRDEERIAIVMMAIIKEASNEF